MSITDRAFAKEASICYNLSIKGKRYPLNHSMEFIWLWSPFTLVSQLVVEILQMVKIVCRQMCGIASQVRIYNIGKQAVSRCSVKARIFWNFRLGFENIPTHHQMSFSQPSPEQKGNIMQRGNILHGRLSTYESTGTISNTGLNKPGEACTAKASEQFEKEWHFSFS